MIVGHGIDIIETQRIGDTIDIYGERFLHKIYTSYERSIGDRRKVSKEIYAAYWAAKEAVMKALGTGFRKGVCWRDIEIRHEESGKPYIKLYGTAKKIAEELKADNIQVSLSHLEDTVMASVIFEML